MILAVFNFVRHAASLLTKTYMAHMAHVLCLSLQLMPRAGAGTIPLDLRCNGTTSIDVYTTINSSETATTNLPKRMESYPKVEL